MQCWTHILILIYKKNDNDPKFKVGDQVIILKYKKIFGKFYMPNWSKEAFVIEKAENSVPLTFVIEYFEFE